MNRNQSIFHFTCLENVFNLIFTHSRKLNATKIIKKELKIIQTKFNAIIVFFRIDDKKPLKKEFDEIISKLKITYKLFAFYIFIQNNHLERKNKNFSNKNTNHANSN